jgi:hypothetical protein
MVCNQKIENLQWTAQGHTFISAVGVLPLRHFDMILGQDWLEWCSPMWVHWAKKLMRFTLNGTRVELQGLTHDLSKCPVISKDGLKGLMRRQALTHCIQFRLKQEVAEDLEV